MQNKVLTVSVGIAAYNEENTIGKVLKSILNQDSSGWVLKEIIVANDGSSDDTASEVLKIKNKHITLINDGKRRGKTARLQQIFKLNQSDILCLFDADIVFKDRKVIQHLIQALNTEKVALVGGNSRPVRGNTFLEKAIYSTFEVFDASRLFHNGGNNIFCSTGSCLALTDTLAKQIKFPKGLINEDAFMYFTCIEKGYRFKYAEKAVINYFLPHKVSDYIKQVLRSEPRALDVELRQYFPMLVDRELKRNTLLYFKSIFQAFLRNPVGVIYITIINLLCIPFIALVINNYKLDWFTAHSSHNRQ